eukprot:TRINITY_DN3664_c0_g1_i2.p2 TRINITY_DN3664_c0_g1~~TRINITY_DN3664_c0_g1_i2.p2  ORF type:complete len:351 (-),score=76.72 TRINITY_DN3664_c0_g1_i2:467-1519(-)
MSKNSDRKQSREHTKVVVRGLPPMLTEAAFLETIQRLYKTYQPQQDNNGNELKHNWFQYWPGKVTKQQRQIMSRAYLNFDSTLAVQIFAKSFNNHKFVDTQGTQFFCSVELAPFQKIPKEKKKKKKDPREGTIDKDPEFKAFLAEMEEVSKPRPSAEAWLAKQEAEQKEREAVEGPKSDVIVTPLMQHLREKYAAKLAKRASGSSRGSRGRDSGSSVVGINNEDQSSGTNSGKQKDKSSNGKSSGKSGRRRDRERGGERGSKDSGRDSKEKRISRDAQVGEVKLKQKNSGLSDTQKSSSDTKDADEKGRVVEVGGGSRRSREQNRGGKGQGGKGGGGGTSQTMRWVPKPG